MKKDIAEPISKCPNWQQVKVEHQISGGLAQNIEHAEWKYEMINVYFVIGLPKYHRHHDSIWVIINRMTESANFFASKDHLFGRVLCKVIHSRGGETPCCSNLNHFR